MGIKSHVDYTWRLRVVCEGEAAFVSSDGMKTSASGTAHASCQPGAPFRARMVRTLNLESNIAHFCPLVLSESQTLPNPYH